MLSTVAILSVFITTALARPLSLAVSADWPTNVVMTSGSAQFAMWVPTDGNVHSSSSITCLNIGASSTGSCSVANVDQVGVLNGYSCAFAGSSGWYGSQTGTSSTGWLSVAPPQLITSVACVENSS